MNYRVLAPVVAAVALLLSPSCSSDPTIIVQNAPDQGVAIIDPAGSGTFSLGTVEARGGGAIRVDGTNLHFDPTSEVLSFDLTLTNASNHDIPAPIRFVISSINPEIARLLNADGPGPDEFGFPYFQFDDYLGGDHVLSPGEISGPRSIEFFMKELGSFSMGFHIDLFGSSSMGRISGVVFLDVNKDGKRDWGEPGIRAVSVHLENGPEILLLTDERGEYQFRGLLAGVYPVVITISPNWPPTTPNPLLVVLATGQDGSVRDFEGADFGLAPPPSEDAEVVFGPVVVGPDSPNGEVFEATIVIPGDATSERRWAYFLVSLVRQVNTRLVPAERVVVEINDTKWIDWETGGSYLSIVKLPPTVLPPGENTLRIIVEGNSRSRLGFLVTRVCISACDEGSDG
ncbi:MAG: SdrD B-like domain-containing protein [Candidatus Krumholzibacteria bacterium]